MIEVEVDPKEFGRIEAQTARQNPCSEIKEAERQQVYEEYKDREGEVVSGHIQRTERGSFILDLERTEESCRLAKCRIPTITSGTTF